MAHPTVPPVVPLRIDSGELAHPPGEVAFRGFDQQVVVVVHQAVGVAPPVIPLDHQRQEVHKRVTIGVIVYHGHPGIAPPRDVVERPWKLDPQRPRHLATLVAAMWRSKT